MAYTLSLQTEAILEIQDAFEWYEEQKDGLGYELLAEIEFCYKKLIERPDHFSYINSRYRRIKTNRFPYILVFEIEDKQVIVNTFRHVKRKPM